jgi:hypothetical protein
MRSEEDVRAMLAWYAEESRLPDNVPPEVIEIIKTYRVGFLRGLAWVLQQDFDSKRGY